MKHAMLMLCAVALLAGCSSSTSTRQASYASAEEKAVRTRADYWQRADTVSAQYMTGPKAQHQLHKDIAACVAEVRELVRLGSIRKAEPPAGVGMTPPLRAGWHSPTRDGPLYTEYTDYQDFDGCMKHKGWERVDYVRPTAARAASKNYVHTILGHTLGWATPTNYQMSGDGTSQDQNFNR